MSLASETKFALTWSGNDIECKGHEPHSCHTHYIQHWQDRTALKMMKITSSHPPYKVEEVHNSFNKNENRAQYIWGFAAN